MNILSVIEVLGRGGAETTLVDLVVGLDQHRHAVWHLSNSNELAVDRSHVRRLRAAGAIVRDVHWQTFATPADVDGALDGFRPDVVIFHWWANEPWSPWVAAAANWTNRPAFVCVLHTARISVSSSYDAHVLVADFQRASMPHVAATELRVIPNALDLARFSSPSRASSSEAGDPFVIGVLARLRPLKVPPTLVHDAMRWGIPDSRWLVAGDGPLLEPLVADAARLAPTGNFRLLGNVPRTSVPRFLSGLDVLCHVVHDQTLDSNPIGVLEALAAGVPVVAERRGGLPELIEHGRNGLLADDVEEVGELLRRLAGNRRLTRRLADGARRSAARFDRRLQLAAFSDLIEFVQRVPAGAAV